MVTGTHGWVFYIVVYRIWYALLLSHTFVNVIFKPRLGLPMRASDYYGVSCSIFTTLLEIFQGNECTQAYKKNGITEITMAFMAGVDIITTFCT